MKTYIKQFSEISINDIASVGGKNASLGEMYSKLSEKNISIPDGFAIVADGYRLFISENKIGDSLNNLINKLDTKGFTNLNEIGEKSRNLIKGSSLPDDLKKQISIAYENLCKGQK